MAAGNLPLAVTPLLVEIFATIVSSALTASKSKTPPEVLDRIESDIKTVKKNLQFHKEQKRKINYLEDPFQWNLFVTLHHQIRDEKAYIKRWESERDKLLKVRKIRKIKRLGGPSKYVVGEEYQ